MEQTVAILEEVRFTKEQILCSEKYKVNRDFLGVIKNNQTYTLKEIDDIVQKFMKGKVK